MKRQHPTDPNLFWCPKCQTYKVRGEFVKRSNSPIGIAAKCKRCHADYAKGKYREDPKKSADASRRYAEKHPEKLKKSRADSYMKHRDRNIAAALTRTKIWRKNNPKKRLAATARYCKKASANVTDFYIKRQLRKEGEEVTPELIEVKRQQIIAKRTLKQFKKWRKENESNCADVSGKQQPYEENHEGGIQIR